MDARESLALEIGGLVIALHEARAELAAATAESRRLRDEVESLRPKPPPEPPAPAAEPDSA